MWTAAFLLFRLRTCENTARQLSSIYCTSSVQYLLSYWLREIQSNIWWRLITWWWQYQTKQSNPAVWKWKEKYTFSMCDIGIRAKANFSFRALLRLLLHSFASCPPQVLSNESLNCTLPRNNFGDLSGRQVHPGTEYGFGTSYHGAVDLAYLIIQGVSEFQKNFYSPAFLSILKFI